MFNRTVFGRLCLATSMWLVLASNPASQVIQGQIAGTITDESGAALPGVTVTLTSPALQVKQLVQVSSDTGEYQFAELPTGMYRLTYELSGFATLVREEVRLTTGFAARVDAVLKVGSLEESVTVVGGSPLVDVSNTHGGTVVDAETLAAVPTSMTMQDVYLISGGVTAAVPPTNGSGGVRELATVFAPVTYGQQTSWNGYQSMDGILTYSNQVPDLTSVDEVDVRTFGNTADVCCPGYASILIIKSGGNEFHGSARGYYQNENFQGDNLDDELRAQGLSRGQIKYYNDLSADLGGRIIANKLWFYTAFHEQRNKASQPGFSLSAGPDGVFGTADDVPAFPVTRQSAQTVKLSYQVHNNHKFVGLYHKNNLIEEASKTGGGGFRFTPFESTSDYSQPYPSAKGEWQGVFGPRFFVSTVVAATGFAANRDPQPCCADFVSTYDLVTTQETGAFWNTLKGTRAATRYQVSGNVTYLPSEGFLRGHEIRTGGATLPEKNWVDFPVNLNGDYRLVFNNSVPAQFWTMNYPHDGTGWTRKSYLYLTDSWTPTTRLTLNLGLRWDNLKVWLPEQVKEPGPWPSNASGQVVPAQDISDWQSVAPRVAAAFDLFGSGKTVLKATWGRYFHDFGYGYPNQFNANASAVTTQYRWTDPTGCRCYVPGTINLDPNGADVLATVGTATAILDPNLNLIHTDEVSTSIEHELGGAVAIRALYLYKKQVDTHGNYNVLRPYESWNQVLNRQDPGPDGRIGSADDGSLMTVYDYDPALRGSQFVRNETVNANRVDSWQNIELSLRKRQSGNWFGMSSLLLTKNHKWRTLVVQSPNDELFPLNETWLWSYRLSAGYSLPWDVQVSSTYQADNGFIASRTANFAAPSSGNIQLPVESPKGQGPSRHVVNLRGSKVFSFGSKRLSADIDVFNLFNTNVGWAYSMVSGPSFGYVTDLPDARVARFGVVYRF